MFIHHVGSLAAVRAALKGDVKVIPMPGATGSGQGTLGTMSGNVILAASHQQGLAWDWISWLDAHKQMLKLSTSAQGQLPVLTSVATMKPFSTDPALKVAVAAESYATSWPGVVGTSTVVNKDWEPTIQSAFEGQSSSLAMLTTIASDLSGR